MGIIYTALIEIAPYLFQVAIKIRIIKMSALKSFQPVVLSVLRIVAAYLFLLHGTAKFFSFPMSMGGAPEGLMLVAGILEIVGGILLILGLFTRPAAFILSGQMAAAYFMAHASSGNVLFPLANQANLPFCSASYSCIWQ